jgi:hypothetical protein
MQGKIALSTVQLYLLLSVFPVAGDNTNRMDPFKLCLHFVRTRDLQTVLFSSVITRFKCSIKTNL